MPEAPSVEMLTLRPRRRCGGRLRSCLLAAAAVILLVTPAEADRILSFTVSTGSIAGVRAAAVNVDGMVVMRLRSPDGDGLAAKAEKVASRLTELALAGLRPEQVSVGQLQGQWAVTGGGKLIVTADAETAAASGLTPRALCDTWRARIAEVLREPYLIVEPRQLLVVPYGEQRTIRFGGTVDAKPRIESMAPGIATVEQGTARALVRGVGTGATVILIEAGDLQHAVTVEVKKWAARIAANAVLTTLPGGVPEPMTRPAILNAALSAVQAQPRAIVRVAEPQRVGDGYSVPVSASGVDYLAVSGTLPIGMRGGLAPIPPARSLLISNYPEKVDGIGALMRQSLAPGTPARLMWHHKNYVGRPVVLAVRLLNAGAGPARVRLGWAQAGPDGDEIFVGYNAMVRYWESVRKGAGFLATVPPGCAFETSAMEMKYHDVVSGLMDLVADSGENLYVEVLARDAHDAPPGFAEVSGPPGQLAVTPYEFPAVLEAQVDYEVGGRYGHLSIGREDVRNEHGFALAGAYGVSHRVRVNASNPTAQPAVLELALRAGGGVARSVVMVDGAMNCSGILSAGHEQMLERRELAPGASAIIPLEIIPTAGSNLPFTLVVRSRTR